MGTFDDLTGKLVN